MLAKIDFFNCTSSRYLTLPLISVYFSVNFVKLNCFWCLIEPVCENCRNNQRILFSNLYVTCNLSVRVQLWQL